MVAPMEIEKPSRHRQNHTDEFKQAVIAACRYDRFHWDTAVKIE